MKISDDEISENERQKETKSVEKVKIETIEEHSDEDNKSPEKTKRSVLPEKPLKEGEPKYKHNSFII